MVSRTTVLGALLILALDAIALGGGVVYVDDDASNDPCPGDPGCSDPLEDGSPLRPFDAIQEGLDAALNDDEVIVMDGTYRGAGNRDLDFDGKRITVRSENGPATCIVDCEAAGRGFRFHSGETSQSALIGFTITRGEIVGGNGGAILCESSAPTIERCVLEANIAVGGDTGVAEALVCEADPMAATGFGGGLHCVFSDPVVIDCVFATNEARASDLGYTGWGGGIACVASSPQLIDCSILNNRSVGNAVRGTGGGGGILIGYDSHPTLTNCVITGNSATGEVIPWTGLGGGIMSIGCSQPLIRGCTISGNSAYTGGGGVSCLVEGDAIVIDCTLCSNTADRGGGIDIVGMSSPTILRSRIFGNEATGISGGGGITSLAASDPVILDTLLVGNVASASSGEGGAMVLMGGSHGVVINCTVVANSADGLTGGICSFGAKTATTVSNCIVRSNTVLGGGDDPQLIDLPIVGPSETTVRYCNVEGGWSGAGEGIIDVDPGFAGVVPTPGDDGYWCTPDDDGDLSLSADSLCIDAGLNWSVPQDGLDLDADGDTSELMPLDIDGNPRFSSVGSLDDSGCGVPVIVDIGAYEAPGESVNPIVYSDITGDGVVDFADLLEVLGSWGPCGACCLADLDVNGTVDMSELLDVLLSWTRS